MEEEGKQDKDIAKGVLGKGELDGMEVLEWAVWAL
jgi:hypothetical protein